MAKDRFFVAYAPDINAEVRDTTNIHNLSFRAILSNKWEVIHGQMKAIAACRLARAAQEHENAQAHYNAVMALQQKDAIKE